MFNKPGIFKATYISVFLFLTVACREADREVPLIEADFPIIFQATTSPQSRGQLEEGEFLNGMGVLAYLLPPSQNETTGEISAGTMEETARPDFMYNQYVVRNTADGTFSYAPQKYWPTNPLNQIKFFAYAPYVAQNTDNPNIKLSPNTTAGYPTIAFRQKLTANNQLDLLVASVKEQNIQSGSGGTPPTVKFPFAHALTKVIFSAVYNADRALEVQVISITLKGIKNECNGKFLSDGFKWGTPLDNSSVTYTLKGQDLMENNPINPQKTGDVEQAYTQISSIHGTLLLVPQEITENSVELDLEYSFEENGFNLMKQSYKLPAGIWKSKQSINYRLVIPISNNPPLHGTIEAKVEEWKDVTANNGDQIVIE